MRLPSRTTAGLTAVTIGWPRSTTRHPTQVATEPSSRKAVTFRAPTFASSATEIVVSATLSLNNASTVIVTPVPAVKFSPLTPPRENPFPITMTLWD